MAKDLEFRLREILFESPHIRTILERVGSLGLPHWYLAAGCVSQTVWNFLSGFDPENGIGDYDLVYYDGDDISEESQERYDRAAKDLFKNLPHPIEAVNEARVHLWLPKYLGHDMEPYRSSEDAIRTWAFDSSCVGVRYEDGNFTVYAPYRLEAMFAMELRENGNSIYGSELDQKKVFKWTALWPKLKVIRQSNS